MGSGCNNNYIKNSCFQQVSSDCVKWIGNPIPSLNICTGDTLTEVETEIVTALQSALNGSGINLTDLDTTCDFILNQMLGLDINLVNILQVLINSSCSLKTLIDTLTTQINTPITYDLVCLTVANPTTANVLQAVITQLCTLQTSVASITNDIVGNSLSTTISTSVGNGIINNINSCGGKGITKTGSGATATLSINALVPPFCPLPYVGLLSNFDSTGVGIAGSGYCGWYICNGNNNTPDMRGYGFAGATSLPGVNSPALDSRVDPTTNSDLTYQTSIGDKNGEVKHQLIIPEIPSHEHTVTDPGHFHSVVLNHEPQSGQTTQCFTPNNVNNGITQNTTVATTGITISATGSDFKHENRQPTTYGVWIMRLS